jgi:hypothetical protein
MKKALLILGSLVVVGGLVWAVVFYTTSGAVETADSFFRAAAAGDFEDAKKYLAEGFKSSTSDEELVAFLEGAGLLEYRESSWGGRSVDTSSGKLTGRVLTESGGSIPLTITFVREDDAWKIYYIQREGAGVDTAAALDTKLPSRVEAAKLVTATTNEFALAVNAKDLSPLHANASLEFQQQVSVEELNQNFAPFLTQDIDLTVLQDYQPMFTSDPALSADGVLQLEGYFSTSPSRAHFRYRYVYRDQDWRLLGINFNLTPVEQ